jgi:hypothetical protein
MELKREYNERSWTKHRELSRTAIRWEIEGDPQNEVQQERTRRNGSLREISEGKCLSQKSASISSHGHNRMHDWSGFLGDERQCLRYRV